MTLRRRGPDWLLNAFGGLALLYLLVPIAIIIVFSFNQPRGRFNFIWQEFSLNAWKDPFAVPGIGDALRNSLEIADYPTAAALSFLLMAFMLIIVLVWARVAGTEALLGTEAERR